MRYDKLALFLLILLTVLLSAGCGGGGGSTPPTVLVSLAVTPANSTFVEGTVLHYTATGTYSNGAVIDITGLASWTSSATNIATVSDTAGTKGTVTAVAPGTATITAVASGISASTALTVSDSGVSTGANVMTVTVNGSLCSDATSTAYFNKPCVSVTVCNPGTSVCQTVNDILLDTGSYGLRVFAQAIPSLTLTQVASGTGSLAGCVQFADGSSLWGPIKLATVQLGNEPPVQVPIQVVQSTFGTRPAGCANADSTPIAAGFNGILGVGVFEEDCGTACVNSPSNGLYYSCTGTSCVGTTVPLANQVANPVASLGQDNNGIQLQFPSVPLGGVGSITGAMVLGIGTQSNNSAAPGAQTMFPLDFNGDMRTLYASVNNASFFDTGSNAYFIPNVQPSVLPPCDSPNQEWYCPPVTRTLLATNIGISGSPSADTTFFVSNFLQLFSSGNKVFSDIAGTSTFGFDWGLPFFMGRNVYFGYSNRLAPVLGTGPYVAF